MSAKIAKASAPSTNLRPFEVAMPDNPFREARRRRPFRGPRLPAEPLSLTLTQAASRQVEAAIRAFERGTFEVAVTLAGAGEGMIKREGHYLFAALRDNPRAKERFAAKKDWINQLNREHYWLKHGGDDAMEISCFDAAMMISRALTKLEAKDWTPFMEEFRAWFLENIDVI
ncbi:hypothetical protein [Bradyrhizobium vignae]|uniref:hypothetical protein n=1 Tax=Bradyrhizobium vignae TaxID=1549949 RepID=UPI00100A7038|nr:hypothetical protein [Bradyrhizobium vignae]RXG92291.1 hypothetical protein EAV90_27290 [Bradyrhizobium vignae]